MINKSIQLYDCQKLEFAFRNIDSLNPIEISKSIGLMFEYFNKYKFQHPIYDCISKIDTNRSYQLIRIFVHYLNLQPYSADVFRLFDSLDCFDLRSHWYEHHSNYLKKLPFYEIIADKIIEVNSSSQSTNSDTLTQILNGVHPIYCLTPAIIRNRLHMNSVEKIVSAIGTQCQGDLGLMENKFWLDFRFSIKEKKEFNQFIKRLKFDSADSLRIHSPHDPSKKGLILTLAVMLGFGAGGYYYSQRKK